MFLLSDDTHKTCMNEIIYMNKYVKTHGKL